MWQRKQTVFLIIVGACMTVSILFPVWQAGDGSAGHALFPLHYTVTENGIKNTQYFPYAATAILAIAAATVAFFEIGKFRNRMLQIKLGAFNSLLMAGSLGSAVYFATSLINATQIAGTYGLALWLPVGALISNMIANRFIRRDEKLVRDSERLR